MTRKHFKALADALKASDPRDHFLPSDEAIWVWVASVHRVADACQSFNPQFDRAKFYAACGWEG